jgi:hypothetical protein
MRKTIVACTATALVIGAGTATASSLISGSQIRNGTLTSADVKNGSLRGADIRKGTITKNRLSPTLRKQLALLTAQSSGGTKVGPQGPKGDPGGNGGKGDKGDAGANGLDSDQPRTVTDGSLRGFTLAPYGDNSTVDGRGTENTAPNGTITFEAPPTPSALGTKAMRMTSKDGDPSTDPDAGRTVVAYAPLPVGTDKPLLRELTTADYESYVAHLGTQPNALDVAMKFEVLKADVGTPSGYTTVVFEPYQNGDPDVAGVWHRHYVRSGKVWSSRTPTSGNCTQAVPCPFDQFITENPDAIVQTAKLVIGQNSGIGWPGFSAFVDDVRLGFDGDFTRYDLGG